MLANSAGIRPTPRLGTDPLSFTTSKHPSNLWHQRRSARATSLEGDPLAKDLASVPKGPVRVPTSEWRTPRGQGRRRRSKRRRPIRRMVVSLSSIEATCGGSGSQFQLRGSTQVHELVPCVDGLQLGSFFRVVGSNPTGCILQFLLSAQARQVRVKDFRRRNHESRLYSPMATLSTSDPDVWGSIPNGCAFIFLFFLSSLRFAS